MKIKEVCALTELSERTIRFYAEKKLITPQTSEQNGRTYTEYTAADVDALRTIAVLRRMLFSLEEIQRMNSKPKEIPQVLAEYYERIAEEAEVRAEILALDSALLAKSKNVTELARQMKSSAARRRLPESDVNPNFGRLDEEPVPNAEQALAEYLGVTQRRAKTDHIITVVIAAINVLWSFTAMLFGVVPILWFLFELVVSIALITECTWARGVFVVASLFYVPLGGLQLLQVIKGTSMQTVLGLILLVVLNFVYRGGTILFLTKSGSRNPKNNEIDLSESRMDKLVKNLPRGHFGK